MKDREGDTTSDEILYAQGKKPFDSLVQADYLKILDLKAAGIKEAFARQQEAAAVFYFFFERISTFLIYIYRNHGIRKSSRRFSHVGSLHAINLLMRWKSRSSLR
jgi:hypothetical protein